VKRKKLTPERIKGLKILWTAELHSEIKNNPSIIIHVPKLIFLIASSL
jgi:hypothetical protein